MKAVFAQFLHYNQRKTKKIIHSNEFIPINISNLRSIANLKLKNFSGNVDKINEKSSYVEIPNSKTRFVVKKTSLVWFLRQHSTKLSNDRLLRVRGSVAQKKSYSITMEMNRYYHCCLHISWLSFSDDDLSVFSGLQNSNNEKFR